METKTNQRTTKQNSALHLYFTLLADELNLAGLDIRKTLKADFSIPWSGERVKELIWRPIQEAQLKKSSTTDLTTKEIDLVFDTINRAMSENHGITVIFPSKEEVLEYKKQGSK